MTATLILLDIGVKRMDTHVTVNMTATNEIEIDEPRLRNALARYRLANKLSFDRLAADMIAVLGPERAPAVSTLHDFLKGTTQPFDLTLYQIGEYLKARGVAA